METSTFALWSLGIVTSHLNIESFGHFTNEIFPFQCDVLKCTKSLFHSSLLNQLYFRPSHPIFELFVQKYGLKVFCNFGTTCTPVFSFNVPCWQGNVYKIAMDVKFSTEKVICGNSKMITCTCFSWPIPGAFLKLGFLFWKTLLLYHAVTAVRWLLKWTNLLGENFAKTYDELIEVNPYD